MITVTKRLAIGAGLALAAAGCADVNLHGISRVDHYPNYSPHLVQYAVADGELNTEIYGQPFANGVDAEAIANSLQPPGYLPPAKLTTKPSADPNNDGQRLVLLFNPEVIPNDNRLCVDPGSVPRGRPTAEFRVFGAFCSGENVASTAFGIGDTGSGPSDPVFHKTMTPLIYEILPQKDPNNDGHDIRVD